MYVNRINDVTIIVVWDPMKNLTETCRAQFFEGRLAFTRVKF